MEGIVLSLDTVENMFVDTVLAYDQCNALKEEFKTAQSELQDIFSIQIIADDDKSLIDIVLEKVKNNLRSIGKLLGVDDKAIQYINSRVVDLKDVLSKEELSEEIIRIASLSDEEVKEEIDQYNQNNNLIFDFLNGTFEEDEEE